MSTLNIFKRILIISWLFFFISEPVNAGEIVPGFVEPILVSDVRSVDVDSSSNCGVFGPDYFDYSTTCGNMMYSFWVKIGKFSEDSFSKLVGCFDSSLFKIASESEERDKTGQKNTSRDSVKVSDDIIGHWVWFYVILISFVFNWILNNNSETSPLISRAAFCVG